MLQFALGGPAVFLLPILFLVAVGAAFVVVVDSITDRDLTLEHRLIGLLLSAAVIPAAILGIHIAAAIGYFDDEPTASARVVALVATVVSVLVLLAVKPRCFGGQVAARGNRAPEDSLA